MEITREKLKKLEKAQEKLQALEGGGVDNWEFYGEAMDTLIKKEEIEESINDSLVELEEVFYTNRYEPSERGAGFACKEEGRDLAEEIIYKIIANVKKIEESD